MAKGKKTGGRVKGSKNKLGTFKDAVLRIYDAIGGDKNFREWASKNQDAFYSKIAPRLIPTEVNASVHTPQPLQIELTDGTETAPGAE